jgi:Kef-type K+ transport system membrane component KefB
MVLLSLFEFTLPLKNPVLIFSLILFIILFAPIVLNRFRIPHLIGLIIAGAVIGPNGLNFILRDSSFILFGAVGLLYIMFLAGLEIDLAQFRKNSMKSLTFGMYTFLIPMAIGTTAGRYILEYSWPTSILLASMFASHTLIAYPIISKLGVTRNRAVNIAVGGTMITDTLALLVLAAIVGMSTGNVDQGFWWQLGFSVLLFGAIVMLLFPIIGRWFFKRFDDSISQYIFVLAMVFLGAFLAEAAGIEAIIGAFLAGLALNRLIPHTSPLMNRIEFVGNALFIPFFLIGVGMLINYKVFFTNINSLIVGGVMIASATSAKWIAAWLTQKTFKFNRDERRVIFGLSNAQAAATLAAVLVGYNIILNRGEMDAALLEGIIIEPERLLDESILNGTILMILVTCTIASIAAQRGAQNLALSEAEDEAANDENDERILIPIGNINNAEELVNLSITVKSKKNKSGLYALSIVSTEDEADNSVKQAKKILEKAESAAAATDNHMTTLLRYDLNITSGVLNVVKENHITDIILGIQQTVGLTENFLGSLTEGILGKSATTTFVYKPLQPLATLKRHVVIIPDRAEREIGFPFWIIKVWNIGRNTGAKMVFYAAKSTLDILSDLHVKHPIDAEFREFNDWNDFLIIAREVKVDDNLIVVLSKKDRPSYHNKMSKIPTYLNKYFIQNNFLLIFPMQTGDSHFEGMKNPSMIEPLEKLDDIGKTIAALFKKK